MMPRRRILLLVAALLVVGAIVVSAFLLFDNTPVRRSLAGDHRPNILFVSMDTVRADHLSCYGYARQTSPNLDRLAQDGVRFERAISTSSYTLPSHVSMFTGQEMGVHTVVTIHSRISERATTITEVLQQAGYTTIGFGSAPYLKKQFGFAQGFDIYDDRLANVGTRESHEAVTSEKVIDRALDQIRDHRNERWFTFIHMWDPHYDYLPPPPFDKMFAGDYRGSFSMHDFERNRGFAVGMNPADLAYTVSQYDGEIAWTDNQLGRLFAELKKMGLYDQTAIVITADHGDEFLEHGHKGHGHTLYDEMVRVPLIVKLPGAPAAKVIPCAVSLLDLFPTLAEMAGIKRSGYEGNGRSLLDLILARRPCDSQRELTSETNLARTREGRGGTRGYEMMLERGGVKYFYLLSPPQRQMLFDINRDPAERQNLVESDAARAAELRERLIARHRRDRLLGREMSIVDRNNPDRQTVDQLRTLGYVQ